MGLISWVVVGTTSGLLARRMVPGPDPGRFVVTIILGMATRVSRYSASKKGWQTSARPATSSAATMSKG